MRESINEQFEKLNIRAEVLKKEPGTAVNTLKTPSAKNCARRGPSVSWQPKPGLPVSEKAGEIIEVIRKNQVFILTGETGSGKTTQLPKLCVLAGRGRRGKIAHTQPRRIAASSLAARISDEIGAPLGSLVGFKVRFTDVTGPQTVVKLMTDGILLAETQTDPLLRAYDTIIIDEAHERSLNIDFLLGYLKTLIAKRRDLKVIITSATIDAERFARHFANGEGVPAPVLNVSGRTYPVQIRYEPVSDDEDDLDDNAAVGAIIDAVDELARLGPGDILVFLPGEAEIRLVQDKMVSAERGRFEILPLYARLSAAAQNKVFQTGGRRRVVLSTNVAETSVTVPGIRYVVDTGFAKVKRYSYRTKVDQLLVEPISQAAANQRAGRCGRVADGVCVRLYSQEDFEKRARFSDPEILRTNLASVILRMKTLNLGDVRDFPFVQAPPPKAIADGMQLLSELAAINDAGELTEIGKEMSRLPVDPKVARMLIEANARGALSEVLVISSALSIQDPRERPLDAQNAADKAHEAFDHEDSDFLSYLNIWKWFETALRRKETNKKLSEEIKRLYFSARRLREWRNVYREIRQTVLDMRWRINEMPAREEQVEISLLSGLLGRVGQRVVDPAPKAPPYAGARGIKFFIWPGSPQAKKVNRWIMANEIVQTSRLFARTVAGIDPRWLEVVGGHLIKKTYSGPHWEKSQSAVMAAEKGTLYGLTVYSGRKTNYSSIDPKACHELFLRQGLVGEGYDTNAPFFQHNKRLVAEIRNLEHKARRMDVLVDEETIYAFYDSVVPADIVNGAGFEVWRRQAEKKNPKVLFLSREMLLKRDSSFITPQLYPKKLKVGGNDFALGYHFEPGSPRDGVTLTVPVEALNSISPDVTGWLVPGMIREKIQALVKTLPQKYRRLLVPVADYCTGFLDRNGASYAKRPLLSVLSEDIFKEKGIRVTPQDFKLEQVPRHLFMNFRVVDSHLRQLGEGRNLSELKAELAPEIQKALNTIPVSGEDAQIFQEQITDWSVGDLPEIMEIKKGKMTLVGYPALVDKGAYCVLEVFDDASQARQEHRDGLIRLIRLQLSEQIKYLKKNLNNLQQTYIKALSVPSLCKVYDDFEDFADEVVTLAIIESAFPGEALSMDGGAFRSVVEKTRGKLNLIGHDIELLVSEIIDRAYEAAKKLKQCSDEEAVQDIEKQFSWLFAKNFMIESGLVHLRHYPRYMKSVLWRLEKIGSDRDADHSKMRDINRFVSLYEREISLRKGMTDARLEEFRWLVEELRVSLFSQRLKTPVPVSVKRLEKIWLSIKYQS